MAFIAVNYYYTTDIKKLDAVRPEHRAFLASLFEKGQLVASGPLAKEPASALVIVRADTVDAALEILDADPFRREGLIFERVAQQWNPLIGVFADQF
ncbi:hypothetical protein JT358_09895 [Micrococcales bacterium 31B]|nr:hypothetical protein [Micrococcales bacterium 31B]